MSRFHKQLKNKQQSQRQADRTKEQLGQQGAISDALSLPLVGSITMWGGAEAPADDRFLLCDNREYAIVDYPELYAVLGSTHNKGTETPGFFRTPNIPGRTVIGAGSGNLMSTRAVADEVGNEFHSLSTAEMPSHNHGGSTGSDGAHDHGGDTASAGGHTHTTFGTKNADYNRTGSFDAINALTGSSGGQTGTTSSNGAHTHTLTNHPGHTHSISSSGSGSQHNNMQPSIALHFIIRAKT